MDIDQIVKAGAEVMKYELEAKEAMERLRKAKEYFSSLLADKSEKVSSASSVPSVVTAPPVKIAPTVIPDPQPGQKWRSKGYAKTIYDTMKSYPARSFAPLDFSQVMGISSARKALGWLKAMNRVYSIGHGYYRVGKRPSDSSRKQTTMLF